jgi:Type II secretion system (T2SS), protein E, N-terminal domain
VANIIELLVKIQLIDERQHDAVMSRSRSSGGGHVVQQVAEMGYATEGTVARAISVELGLPRIDLAMTPPEPAAVALLDARTCAERFVLPVALRENGELLWLAMADPTDQDAIGVVRRKTQKRVRPAVAGPTEILRAVRTLYASPNAGSGKPEAVQDEKLAAIEIENAEQQAEGGDEAFEVVNVGDDISSEAEGTPLSRIAKQLGVEVPANMPSRRETPAAVARVTEASEPPPPIETRASRAISAIPPKTDPRMRQEDAPAPPMTFDELFAAGTGGTIGDDDLAEEDLSTLAALRTSMEKGALVLRSLAELCVEKAVFTREEMKRRNQSKG